MVKLRMELMMIVIVALLAPIANAQTENKGGDTINVFDVQKGDFVTVEKVNKPKEELKEVLTKKQYHVTQEHGTEAPFSGALLENKEKGVYQCVVCKTDLFSSETKYNSGTGWPSFWQPVAKENVGMKEDKSLFMRRTEVHCPVCMSHLGHVFDDGPAPTNKRYCINSASLTFEAMKADDNTD